MKALAAAMLVLLACVSLVGVARAESRTALVIGTNRGLSNEPVLQFAESDARNMAQTFVDTHSVDAHRVTTVLGRPLSEVQKALDQVSAGLRSEDELWIFLSGHADPSGVHIDGEVWSWKTFRQKLDAIPVRRLIVFVDACNSGALLTAKGVTLDTPLRVSLQASLRGRVILASSGANELSYESRRLGGSPFAHFLASGLRGAADTGDGKVTLSELYAYLYSRTIAASLGGASGPQHPEQGGWVRGAGEWWLTRKPGGSGDVLLRDATLGHCYVLDQKETRVLAEVSASDPGAVSLPVGAYRVKCLNHDGVIAASLSLGTGRTHVEELDFDSANEELVLARGPGEPSRLSLGLFLGAHFAPSLDGAVTVSLRHSQQGIALGASAGLLGTGRFTAQGELLGALPWWDANVVSLEVGLLVGVESRFDGTDSSLALGPLVELSTPLSSTITVALRQEMTRTIPLASDGEPTLPLVTRLGASVSF